MSKPSTQVIAIGNAIVDVMASCDDALIERLTERLADRLRCGLTRLATPLL